MTPEPESEPLAGRQTSRSVWRFDGQIAGLGTTGGPRIVLGHWFESPLGAFADVMVEDPSGHRTLLAPSATVADFVAGTYRFDEVVIGPVSVDVPNMPDAPDVSGVSDALEPPDASDVPGAADLPDASDVSDPLTISGASSRGAGLTVRAPGLLLRVGVGRRTPLGVLLRLQPRPLVGSPRWASLLDPIVRRVLPGVRTRGTAGGGRQEFYGASDLHRLISAEGSWRGVALGALAPVDPPVTFGFGSAPRRPVLTRIVTTVIEGSE